MDWNDLLPWGFLFFIAPFLLSLRSILVGRRLKVQIEMLTDRVAMLDHRIFRLDEGLTALGAAPLVPPTAAPTTEPSPELFRAPEAAPATPAEPASQPLPETAQDSRPAPTRPDEGGQEFRTAPRRELARLAGRRDLGAGRRLPRQAVDR